MYMTTVSCRCRRGSTTLFVAVVLMGILVASAFLIDAGAAYATHARMQAFADAGADAGAATIADVIVEFAEQRETNPPEGTDPTTVLTEEDRTAILADARIVAAARDYVERNRIAYNATLDEVLPEYPYRPVDCSSVRSAEIRMTVRRNHPFVLGTLLNGTIGTTLVADALRSVRLCPP